MSTSSARTSSFSVNTPVPPKLDLDGVRSQVFQAPSVTSASSSLYQTISSGTRKRHRPDDFDRARGSGGGAYKLATDGDRLDRSFWLGRHANLNSVDMDHENFFDCYGQLPLAPPIEASVDSLMDDGMSGNARKRSRRESWYSAVEQKTDEEQDELTVSGQTKNNMAPPPLPPAQPARRPVSWSESVMSVMERVWNFCWSGAFRGFYAGGGHGYHMAAGTTPQLDEKGLSSSQALAVEKATSAAMMEGDPEFCLHQHDTSPTMQQQHQRKHPEESWVMLPNSDDSPERHSFEAETTPAKRGHVRSRSSVPRVGKISISGPSTPTKIPILSPTSKKVRETPVSVDTQRYVARMRNLEREEDASMRRLNRQLQMMIKEGQQALGAQIGAEDDLDMDLDLDMST